ncbi:hypothetical protein QQ045_012098 [Rhodiola kirilowii]
MEVAMRHPNILSYVSMVGYYFYMLSSTVFLFQETKNADINGPKGIISSIGISILVGCGYIVGITFGVTNHNNSGGYAIAEIFYLAFKNRVGSGTGGIVCLCIPDVAVFFCGMSSQSLTSNSRMAYTFSRDGAMPFSPLWHKVNSHEVPLNAVWFSACISFAMALTLSAVCYSSPSPPGLSALAIGSKAPLTTSTLEWDTRIVIYSSKWMKVATISHMYINGTAAHAGCFRAGFLATMAGYPPLGGAGFGVHGGGVFVAVEALRVVEASDCCGGGVSFLGGLWLLSAFGVSLAIVRAAVWRAGRRVVWGVSNSDGGGLLNGVDSGRAGGRLGCWALLWDVVATAIALLVAPILD